MTILIKNNGSGSLDIRPHVFSFVVSEHGTPGITPEGVPAGGAANQILRKKSDMNYDFQWENPSFPADEIVQSPDLRFVSDTEKIQWNDAYGKRHEHANKAILDEVTAGYTTEERNKLSGVEPEANKYEHPASHSASIINSTPTKRFCSDTEKGEWNDAYDKRHVHENSDVLDSTTASFTAAEKDKLAGIDGGANNYEHPATHPAFMIDQDADHRFWTDNEKYELDINLDFVISQSNVNFTKINDILVDVDSLDSRMTSAELAITEGIPLPETYPASMIIPDEEHQFITAEEKAQIGQKPVFLTLDQNTNIFVTGTGSDGSDVSNSLITASPSPVAVEGLTITNLVQNGRFNSLDGVSRDKASLEYSLEGEEIKFYDSSIVYTKLKFTHFNAVANHVYYVAILGRIIGELGMELAVAEGSITGPVTGRHVGYDTDTNNHLMGFSFTMPSDTIMYPFVRGNKTGDTDNACFCSKYRIFDLTTTFGVGNEPDETWCKENLVYHDNTVSVKNPEIISVGKNLFDLSKATDGYVVDQFTGGLTPSSAFCASDFIKVSPLAQYHLTNTETPNTVMYDINQTFIRPVSTTFTTTEQTAYIRTTCKIVDKNICMVVLGDTNLPYEPYKEDRLHLPITLRSLPNGVRDTVNADGTWTQRISSGVAVATGVAVNTTNYPLAKGTGQFRNVFDTGGEEFGIVGTDSTTAAGTLFYELATPVTTPLESGIPYINAWSGGQMSIQGLYSNELDYTTSLTFPDALNEITSCWKLVAGEKVEVTTTLASDGLTATIAGATAGEVYHVEGRYVNGGDIPVPTEITYPVDRSGVVENVVHQTGQNTTQIEDLREQLAIAQLRIDGIEV